MPLGKIAAKKENPVKALFAKLDAATMEARKHRAKHEHIYEKGDELTSTVESLKEQIKKQLHQQYKGKPSGLIVAYAGAWRVEVTPKNARVIDFDRMLKEQRDLLEGIGAIKKVPATKAHEEVDMSVVDQAMHSKSIPSDIIKQYIEAGDPQTPTVSFKPPEVKKES
jgi:hypothetical protein